MEKKYCKICGKELNRHNKSGYCVEHLPRCGKNNPFFGKTHKKETIDAMKIKCSEASRKLWENEEYRKRVIDSTTGLKRSEEFKETQRKNAIIQFSDENQRKVRAKNMHQNWQNGVITYKVHNSINISKQEKEFIESIQSLGYDVSHKSFLYTENGKKKHLFPDGIIEDKKVILEYNGSFWHADPKRGYLPTDIIHHNVTAAEIWSRDNAKRKVYEENGYRLCTMWSDEFLNDKEESIRKINKIIESYD